MRTLIIFLSVLLAAGNSSSQGIITRDQAPIKADTGKNNSSTTAAMLNDIRNAFVSMEQSIEAAYAKLKKETKDNIDEIEEKIIQLKSQIEALKKQAEKLELIMRKHAEIRDSLNAMLISGSATLSPDEKQLLLKKFDTAQKQFVQDKENMKNINQQIDGKNAEIKKLKDQLKELEAQLAQLEKDKQKALDELEKQKQKAIKETEKRSGERNYNNSLAQQLKNITRVFQDSIRATQLRYRRIP